MTVPIAPMERHWYKKRGCPTTDWTPTNFVSDLNQFIVWIAIGTKKVGVQKYVKEHGAL
jgi:hypothetical protein